MRNECANGRCSAVRAWDREGEDVTKEGDVLQIGKRVVDTVGQPWCS